MRKNWVWFLQVDNNIKLYKTKLVATKAFEIYWKCGFSDIKIGKLPIRSQAPNFKNIKGE